MAVIIGDGLTDQPISRPIFGQFGQCLAVIFSCILKRRKLGLNPSDFCRAKVPRLDKILFDNLAGDIAHGPKNDFG